MHPRFRYLLLLLLLLADLGYSFRQYLGQPLDGDMALCIVPAEEIKPVLDHPLGLPVLLEGKTYPNPNRFFAHWSYRVYGWSAPLFLQRWVSPISSAYLACALAKLAAHLILLALMASAVTGTRNPLKANWLLAAFLMTPFFQANGYNSLMGIIDQSTTYTFFYALPAAVLLLYLLPLFFRHFHDRPFFPGPGWKYPWLLLVPVVCLSGPLNPGIVLVLSAILLTGAWIREFRSLGEGRFRKKLREALTRIHADHYFFLLPAVGFSLYSLYLGSYNSMTIASEIPLVERYAQLPQGLFNLLTRKLALPIVLTALLINAFLVYRHYRDGQGALIWRLFGWTALFALAYILLLPLGGYREYRPFIVRYDSILPVTLALVMLFTLSTLFLFQRFIRWQQIRYLPVTVIVWFAFANADEPGFQNNACEREALEQIADSPDEVVPLEQPCPVLGWVLVEDPEDNRVNAQLLQHWNITRKEKLFYHR